MVENWNSANGFIFYGKSGEIATNRLDDQEVSVLALHLLQACLVYINTLMLQDILAEPTWLGRMMAEERPVTFSKFGHFYFLAIQDPFAPAAGDSYGRASERATGMGEARDGPAGDRHHSPEGNSLRAA